MSMAGLAVYLMVGAAAGWLATTIMKGAGTGVIGNIILGVLGSFFGARVFAFIGIAPEGIVGSVSLATAGAALLLLIVGYFETA